MTTDPTKLVDSEGEEMSLNKVDKALSSIGISMKDAIGQFKDFDDVIFELSSKWETLDVNTQRYIATVMAGNRQQSRFLALVGNHDRLEELYEESENSEGAAALQAAKTMDSIETKIERLKVSFQQFYTSTGVQDAIKGVLEFVTTLINRFNSFSKTFNKFPTLALSLIGSLITSIKSISNSTMTSILTSINQIKGALSDAIASGAEEGANRANQSIGKIGKSGKFGGKGKIGSSIGQILQIAGLATTMIGLGTEDNKKAGRRTIWGSLLGGAGQGLVTGFSIGGPWGMLLGALAGITSALPGVISGFQLLTAEAETAEEKLERLEDELKTEEQESLIAKSELDSLTSYKEKLLAAKDAQYESAEARQAYLDLSNEIAAKFPSLIAGYDAEGNAVISLAEDYQTLLGAKTAVYQKELTEQQDAEIKIWEDRATAAAKIAEERGIYTNQTKLYMSEHKLSWEQANDAWAKQVGYRTLQSSNLDFSEAFVEGAMAEIDTRNWAKAASKHILSAFSGTNFIKELSGQIAEDDNFKGINVKAQDDEEVVIGSGYISLGTLIEGAEGRDKVAAGIRVEGLIQAYAEALEGTREIIDGKIQVIGKEFLDASSAYNVTNLSDLYEKTFEFSYNPNSLLSQLYEERKVVEEQILKQAQNSQKKYAQNMAQASATMYDTEYNLVQEGIWGEIFTERYQDYLDQASNTEGGLIDGKTAAQKLNEDATALSVRVTNFLSANAIQIGKANDYLKNLSTLSQLEVDAYLSTFKDENGEITELGTYLNNIVQSQLQDFEATKALIEIAFGTKYKAEGEDREKFHLAEGLLKDLVNSIDIAFIGTFHKQLIYYKDLMDNIETKEKGGNAQAAYLDLISLITTLDEETKTKAYAILQNGDNTTLTGLYSIIGELAQLDPTIFGESGKGGDFLTAILENHVFNLETEWATYKDKVAKNLTTLEDKMGKALSGMSLTDALSFSDEFDIDLTDLKLENGKFFIDNTDLLIQKYTEQSQQILETLNAETEKVLKDAGFYNIDEEGQITGQVTLLEFKRFKNFQRLNIARKKASLTQELKDIQGFRENAYSQLINPLEYTADQFSDFEISTLAIKLKEKGFTKEYTEALIKEYQDNSELYNSFDNFLIKKAETLEKELLNLNNEIENLGSGENDEVEFEKLDKEAKGLEKTSKIITDYSNQLISSIFLSNGRISDFLNYAKTEILPNLTEEDWTKIQTALSTNDFSGLEGNVLTFVQQYAEQYQEAISNVTKQITDAALDILENPVDAKGKARTARFNVNKIRNENEALYNVLFDAQGNLKETDAFDLEYDAEKNLQSIILKDAKALDPSTARSLASQLGSLDEANAFMAAYFADNAKAYSDAWIDFLSQSPSFTDEEIINFGTSIGKTEAEMRAFFQKRSDGLNYFVSEQADFLDIDEGAYENTLDGFIQSAKDGALSIIEDIFNGESFLDLKKESELREYLEKAGIENVDSVIEQVKDGIKDVGEYVDLLKQLGFTEDIVEKESEAIDDFLKKKNKDRDLRTSQFEKVLGGKAGDEINISALSQGAKNILKTAGILEGNAVLTLSDNMSLLSALQAIESDPDAALAGTSLTSADITTAIQNIFKTWGTLFSDGISGALAPEAVQTLIRDFSLGEKDFFRTSEGFGLTQSALTNVYTKLKETDGYTAQIALNALVENAKESDEEFSDIYQTQKKISKLQEKLNKAKEEETKELQTQLDIAKQVRQDLLSEGNAFNFMESNVPTEVTNPLSAWEGLSQAGQVLLSAEFEEGRMSYENIRAMATYLDSMNISLSNGVTGMQLLQAATNGLTIDPETASLFVDLNTFGEAAFDAEMMWNALMEASLKNAEDQKALIEKRQAVQNANNELLATQKTQTEAEKEKTDLGIYQNLYEKMADLSGAEANWSKFSGMTNAAAALREIQQAYLESEEAGMQAFNHYNAQMLADQKEFTTNATQSLADSTAIIAGALQSGEINLEVSGALDQLNQIEERLQEMQNKGYEINLVYNVTSKQKDEQTAGGTYEVTIEDNGTAEALSGVAGALAAVQTSASNFISATDKIQDKSGAVSATADAINSLESKSVTATVDVTVNVGGENINGATHHTRMNLGGGNAAVAKAKGTLMGELGPELVSANGRYFTVGENGAEFVNLPNDAIVFNHLQTKKLLGNGHISSFGKPITNEKTAVSFAKGNAMASANTLKETHGAWQSLINYLGSWPGLKTSKDSESKETKANLHDLERWYNLLRQIEKLEQQITYQQQLRANLTSGYDHVDSLEQELIVLQKQKKAYEQLAELQRSFYDRRREDLLSTEYSKIFTYDKDGLMQYVDGKGRGLDVLASLNEADAMGVPEMTNKQQVEYLKQQGFDISKFMTKADGTKIKKTDYAAIMEVFWSGIDSWMDELDSLYDEYNEHMTSVEENQEAQNEIIQEYIDNQRAVEDKLFQAIEDREQGEIDRFQKNLDATQDAASQYLEGLNRALDKEREMYNRNEEDTETTRLQRQLAILQRSGGSASEIRSLQDQIDSRLQDSYFSEQERQIQAVQEASDLQLEKMQQQLDVMNETLEYQKENGLLWQEVSDMMLNWTPEAMMDFIERFTKSYREDSLLENEEKTKETLKELEIWDAKQQENGRNSLWETYLRGAKTRFDEKAIIEKELDAKAAYLSTLREGKTEKEAGAAADEIFSSIKKPQDMNTDSSNELDNNKEVVESSKKKSYYVATYSSLTGGGQTIGYSTEAEAKRAAIAAIDAATAAYLKNNSDVPATAYLNQTIHAYKSGIKIKKYAKGGLVDFTGPAWVDGTKAKPEAFLSAEDTALLKSKIFSNSNYSLKSVIEMLESLGRTFSSIDNSSNNREVVFENVEVNIAANAIASDYDARRAGEQVLEELMSIARRNSNIGVARR